MKLILIYLLINLDVTNIIFQERAETENKKYVIPLTIRQYATIIESRFPNIKKMKNLVPPDVWENTPTYNRYLATRMYMWYNILLRGFENGDVYVLRIAEELNNRFQPDSADGEFDVDNDDKFRKFLLDFCDSTVKAIEHGNKIVAHANDGTGVNFNIVVFGSVVDEYMRYFYDAMVGKPKVESSTPK